MTMKEAWEEVREDEDFYAPADAKPIYYWEPDPDNTVSILAYLIVAHGLMGRKTGVLVKRALGWETFPCPCHLIRHLVDRVNALESAATDVCTCGSRKVMNNHGDLECVECQGKQS